MISLNSCDAVSKNTLDSGLILALLQWENDRSKSNILTDYGPILHKLPYSENILWDHYLEQIP